MIELSAADIAGALGGRKHGSYWTARCPAHDDNSPSLSISQGDNGRILVRCHAGCDSRDVIAELDRRGLWSEAASRGDNVTSRGANGLQTPGDGFRYVLPLGNGPQIIAMLVEKKRPQLRTQLGPEFAGSRTPDPGSRVNPWSP